MDRKFTFAPGLVGYGTRGIDGSVGLQGLAFYFSEFDGVTESVQIKNKIISNNTLFSASTVLPGYPDRIYITGDLFVDKNSKIYQIDLTETNRYVDTGVSFTGTEFFEALGAAGTTGFTRWFPTATNAALIDNVLTLGSPIYDTIPANIYTSNPNEAGQWKYVDILSAGQAGYNYYPFTVYTIGGSNADAMGIMRDQSVNTWHIGNIDENGNQRDIALNLDFATVKIPDGSLVIAGVGSDIMFQRKTSAEQEFKIFIQDDSIGYPSFETSPTLSIESWAANDIPTGVAGASDSVKGGKIRIKGGHGINYGNVGGASNKGGGDGGDVSINGGVGGWTDNANSSSAQGGGGGNLYLFGGWGGDSSDGQQNLSGIGGDVKIFGGVGGRYISAGTQKRIINTMGAIHLRTGEDVSALNYTPDDANILIECTASGADSIKGNITLSALDVSIVADASIVFSAARFENKSGIINLGHPSTIGLISLRGIIDISSGFRTKIRSVSDSTGTVNSTGTNTALEILNNASDVAALGIRNANTGSGAEAIMIQAGPTSASGSFHDTIIYEDNGGTARAVIQFNNTTGAFASASDERLKGNIKDSSINGLNIINNIPVKDFQFKELDASGLPSEILNNDIITGFIAQEIQPHWPVMVDVPEDPNKFLRIRDVQLIPVFHKAIQELSTENNYLKSKVTQLESLVSQLIAVVDPSIS